MQQGVGAQIFRHAQRLRPRQQGRAADREEALGQDQIGPHAGIAPAAGTQRDVEILARQIDLLGRARYAQVDLRMGGAEAAEARQQPFRREGGQHRRAEHPAGVVLMEAPRRPGDAVEGDADLGEIGLRRIGQQQPPADAAKQLEAEPFLERLDLMADRRLGDVELGGRRGKAEMAGRRLEGAQCIEGRQAATH